MIVSPVRASVIYSNGSSPASALSPLTFSWLDIAIILLSFLPVFGAAYWVQLCIGRYLKKQKIEHVEQPHHRYQIDALQEL